MVISRAAEPPLPSPHVGDLYPPEPFRPGWICLWHVQGALRSAVLPSEALWLVPETPETR
jgi:hypothetical protein